MKLNDILDIIADGWKYTIFLNITDGTTTFHSEVCRDLRKGGENTEFVKWIRTLDLNVNRIYGGEPAICIETEPVSIIKSSEVIEK